MQARDRTHPLWVVVVGTQLHEVQQCRTALRSFAVKFLGLVFFPNTRGRLLLQSFSVVPRSLRELTGRYLLPRSVFLSTRYPVYWMNNQAESECRPIRSNSSRTCFCCCCEFRNLICVKLLQIRRVWVWPIEQWIVSFVSWMSGTPAARVLRLILEACLFVLDVVGLKYEIPL